MTLKRIRTVNIQSHKDIIIDLPEKGLVRLEGPNSAGKSVVLKVLVYALENKIAKPKVRAALVSRGCTFGEAIYTRHDDWELTIHLSIEASTTYISLKKPGEDAIVRYLADRNYVELITEFGFHYNAERNTSLNIGEGDKAILFYTTGSRTNYDVVDVALTDAFASQALENLEATIKTARDFRETSLVSKNIVENALGELKVYDTAKLSTKLEKLEKCFNFLSSIYIPNIPPIKEVPKVKFVSVHAPVLPEVKWPTIVSVGINIPDVLQVQDEIQQLRSNVCPTCRRPFVC